MRPYLRVANVFDGYIDTDDVKQMHFSEEEFTQFELRPGDVLLNEGQSRELVGRSAIFRGEVSGACFQNTLIRFRPGDAVTSDYAHLYFRYCLYTGRFAAVGRQTTSIAHLGANRFAEMVMPLPSLDVQASATATTSAIDKQLRDSRERGNAIRVLMNRLSAAALSDGREP
jgi:type I restriction enzyme S subunit